MTAQFELFLILPVRQANWSTSLLVTGNTLTLRPNLQIVTYTYSLQKLSQVWSYIAMYCTTVALMSDCVQWKPPVCQKRYSRKQMETEMYILVQQLHSFL